MQNTNSTWLQVREVGNKVWRIEDSGVSSYLIEGDEKALLIDTGWGIGNLAQQVGELTSRPVELIITHGHIDHVSGVYQFGEVHIHQNDIALMESNYTTAGRTRILTRFADRGFPEHFSKEEWINAQIQRITPFTGERSIDLGGRIIDVIETPGHTAGSICLLDRTERLLFTGDSVSEGNTLLHFAGCLPVSVFLDSMNKLVPLVDQIDQLLPSHGRAPIAPSVLVDLRDGVARVLAGELKGVPHETFLGNGLLCNFGTCGLLYQEDNLR